MSRAPFVRWLPWDRDHHKYPDITAFLRVRTLERLFSSLKADSSCGPVHLDGSAWLAEGYLRTHPDALEQVRRLVASGLLWVGPWYAAPATLSLSSAELLVRNLLLGARVNRQVGSEPHSCIMPVGPVLISQLPQVANGFGLESIVIPVHMGMPTAWPTLLGGTWRGADGSQVSLLFLPWIRSAAEQSWPVPPEGRTAAMIDAGFGCTQQGTWLESVISTAPSNLVGQGEIKTYTDDRQWGRGTIGLKVLPPSATAAYCSTWPELRRATWDALLLLERYAEPFCTAAWMKGNDYPLHYLTRAWRHLILNQRHDALVDGAICVEIGQQMLLQAHTASHLAQTLLQTGLQELVSSPASPVANSANRPERVVSIWLLNPLSWPHCEVATIEVLMPPETEHLELRTHEGKLAPYQLHSTQLVPSPTGGGGSARRFCLSFYGQDLPAMGFQRLTAQATPTRPYFIGESIAAGNTLENRYLRVSVRPNGSLCVENKQTGISYRNCNVFEDSGDIGSLQRYMPPEQDRVVTTYASHAQVTIVDNGMFVGTIQIRHELPLPAGIDPDQNRRSLDQVLCEITSYVTLVRDSPRVAIHTQVTNTARNHRLRVLFSSGVTDGVCRVAQPFDVVEHALRPLEGGSEPFVAQEFLDIGDSDHGLLIATRGWHEYEIKPTPAGTVALTLFRAPDSTSPSIRSDPHSSALAFDYALVPHGRAWAQAVRQAWAFCARPIALSSDELLGADCRPEWYIAHTPVSGPDSWSMVCLEPAPLLISACKRSEDGTAVLVRGFNPTGEQLTARLTTGWPIRRACLARMDETPLDPISGADDRSIELVFAPHQVLTLLLWPDCL